MVYENTLYISCGVDNARVVLFACNMSFPGFLPSFLDLGVAWE